jgi:hypothetical protein
VDVFGPAPDSITFGELLVRRALAHHYQVSPDRFYMTFRSGDTFKHEVWSPLPSIDGKARWTTVEEHFNDLSARAEE